MIVDLNVDLNVVIGCVHMIWGQVVGFIDHRDTETAATYKDDLHRLSPGLVLGNGSWSCTL